MLLQQVLFYLFSAVMLGAATMVITVRNPVYAALFLILTFFSAAALWILLEVEFLAIVLVVVYVGAVMVLFLFVVMMLDINLVPLKEGFARYLPVGVLVGLAMLTELVLVLVFSGEANTSAFPVPVPHAAGYSNTAEIGELLFTRYLWPFEIAGIILLVAIIAAITLTVRQRPMVKRQDPAQQVRARASERVRLVNMRAEKREE